MDLSEDERAELIESMPSATWTRQEQGRYAALLVVIADREELGLPNSGLRLYPDATLPGFPSYSAPQLTLPEILATPVEKLMFEATTLSDDVVRSGTLGEQEMTRLAVLWTALAILREPDND
jgi:hypothetical protein